MSEESKVSPFEQALIDNAGFEEPVVEPEVTEPAVAEPVVEPVVEPAAAEPTTEEPTVETPEEPSSTEPDSTTVDDSTPPAEPEISEPEVGTESLDNWDDDGEPETEPADKDVDSIRILKDFGFEGLTVDQAKEKINKLRETTNVDPFADLPDNLKQAIQIAKDNGDYLEYLGVTSVNYDNVDARILFENNMASYFVDKDGEFDKEGFKDYIDGLDEKEIEIKGKQLKQELIARQQEQTRRLEADAGQRRVQAEKDLKIVLDSVDSIRGFKLKPSHKKIIFDNITSGDMINEMFYDKTGNMDFDKVVKIYFDYKWGDRATKFLQQRMETSAKKELLKELGNVNVTTPPPILPGAVPEKKTAQDLMAEHLTKGGFGN